MVSGRCQMVSGMCYMVTGSCKMASKRFERVLERCQIVSGLCQMVSRISKKNHLKKIFFFTIVKNICEIFTWI